MNVIKYFIENLNMKMFRRGSCGQFWGWDKKYDFCPYCGAKAEGENEQKLSNDNWEKIVSEWESDKTE